MTRNWRLWLVVLFILADVVLVVTVGGFNQDAGWTVARWTYQTLWKYAPKPVGYEQYQPPDRFAK